MNQNKKAFREQMKNQRAMLSTQIRTERDSKIAEHLFNQSYFKNAKCVFCYCSFGFEIDTINIINFALKCGKTVCLPKTFGNGTMTAHKIESLEKGLKKVSFGMLEPDETCQAVDKNDIDLCIVPCLATDRNGFRLGYGGGYYDRFLCGINAKKAVLCYDDRLFNNIYHEEHDIACDAIITESQVINL